VPPVFVGDVQGCAEELVELLEQIERRAGSDASVWFVGDVVNRGPASLRALSIVRERMARGRARMVLGNHEIALLATAFGLRSPGPSDRFQEILEAPDAGDWIRWLRELPLVEEGSLAGTPFAMVHGAVHPDWDLAALLRHADEARRRLAGPEPGSAVQLLAGDLRREPDLDDLARIVSCRSVRSDGSWSSAQPVGDAVAWHEAWRARDHGYGVVFGHWSLQGLLVAPWLRGLDTGCVHHGRGRDGMLTAWLPDDRPDPFAVPDQRFVHVRAHRRYVFDEEGPPARVPPLRSASVARGDGEID
jgi:bis(5'-nucleosyl)-tetraphosphatase (symmetrical)